MKKRKKVVEINYMARIWRIFGIPELRTAANDTAPKVTDHKK